MENTNFEQEKYVNVVILNKKDKPKNVQQHKNSLCSKCGKSFSSNFNLKRHMTSCKLCPHNEKAPRHQCECGRTYSQEWDMKKHKLSCEGSRNLNKCKKCTLCSSLFYHRLQLQAHMKSVHNLTVNDPEIFEFESIEEFRIWKEKIEEDTYTYYSKRTGANVTGVSVNTYYVCQRDGSDRVHSSAPRKTERRNIKGRSKTNRTCWSQMNVKEFRDGSVRVTYHPSHTHLITAADTKHHPLPPSITGEIQRRVAETRDGEENRKHDGAPVKKVKGRSYSLSVRNLRALARKNRKLFRITSEAINENDADELGYSEHSFDPLEQLPVWKIEPEMTRVVQDVSTVESCIWHCNQLKAYVQSGRLSADALAQTENVLSNLLDSCQQDALNSNSCQSDEADHSIISDENDYVAVSVGESHAGLQLATDSNTIYQVVALPPKEEPPSPSPTEELLYQNAVELVGHREFILITHEQQVFQSPVHTVNYQ